MPDDEVPLLAVRMHMFLDWVGEGRPLTATGVLRIADALHLVDLLQTGEDPLSGGQLRRLGSSRDLPGVMFWFDLAVNAGMLRTVRGRLVPVKKNARLAATAAGVCELLLRHAHEGAPLFLSPLTLEPNDLGVVAFQKLWASLQTKEILLVRDLREKLWEVIAAHLDAGNLYPSGTTIEQAKAEFNERVDLVLYEYASLGLVVLSSDRSTVAPTEGGRREAERRVPLSAEVQ